MIIIVKYKTFNCIFFGALNPTFTLQYASVFYYIGSLTLFTVFNIISLSFTLYISSFLILFILLQSLLKYLFLLKSLTQPLLFGLLVLLFLRFLIFQLLQLFPSVFLYTTKVHWFCTILWFLYLLWCFIYRYYFNTSFTSSFFLKNPIINLYYLVNKGFYIFYIFYKY